MKNRSPLVIVGIVAVVLLCICGCIAFFAAGGLSIFGIGVAAAEVPNNFMQAVADGDDATAFSYFSPELQAEFDSAADFGALIDGAGVRPSSWNFNSFNIENNIGEYSGNVTYQDGTSGTMTIDMESTDGEWEIYAFNLERD